MNVHQLLDLTGKRALVTGGGRGLGEQFAVALAEAGADVVVCSRKVEACQQVAAEIAANTGRKTMAVALDLGKPEQIPEVAERITSEFGSIDILVNNAGISWGAPLFEMPLEKWNQVMAVNATASFLMVQQFGKAMVAKGWGRIINVASVAGLFGIDADVMQAIGYHASKGAVIAMTRDLAAKLGPHGVTVNAIAPGFFPTKMSGGILAHGGDKVLAVTPVKRFGGSDDLKGIAVYLASEASAYMTGQVLVVDGGASAL